ncbi:hypothetical protein FOZ63_033775 [Perkinsus olseni]|uniref:Phosphatidic acid phosphatase type 2/haloperoxidase domain-containing protein n=1 Tax=Perkinsus olseni TaxID=32597 RepID=A0A7J6QNK8_PEROL|nr:hypothetical protein FOZ63_033775 [Perkinsus olseni]
MATVCKPAWYVDSDSICPFGEHLIGDITAPFNPDFFDGISIFYGYLLYVVEVMLILTMLWRRGSREYSLVLFIVVIFLLSEFGWKLAARQPRPVGSCNTTCGMPSSHAVRSVALWTILMFDVAYRAYQTEQGYSVSRSFLKKLRSFLRNGHFLPTASAISEDQLVVVVGSWSLVLLPIPLSRVILRDHTPQQVFMGGIIGIVEAAVWHFITLLVRIKTHHYVGARVWKGIFIHNWPAPRCYIDRAIEETAPDGHHAPVGKADPSSARMLQHLRRRCLAAALPVAHQPLPRSTVARGHPAAASRDTALAARLRSREPSRTRTAYSLVRARHRGKAIASCELRRGVKHTPKKMLADVHNTRVLEPGELLPWGSVVPPRDIPGPRNKPEAWKLSPEQHAQLLEEYLPSEGLRVVKARSKAHKLLALHCRKKDWHRWQAAMDHFHHHNIPADEVTFSLMIFGYIMCPKHPGLDMAHSVLEEMKQCGFVHPTVVKFHEEFLMSLRELEAFDARPNTGNIRQIMRMFWQIAMLSKRRRIRLFHQEMERKVLAGQWTTTGIAEQRGEEDGLEEDPDEALREAALKAAYGYAGVRVPEGSTSTQDGPDAVDDGDQEFMGTKSRSRMEEGSSNIEKTGGDVPEGSVAEARAEPLYRPSDQFWAAREEELTRLKMEDSLYRRTQSFNRKRNPHARRNRGHR